ncbi:hypothetical protein Skr01_49920 [Sphaerisporangium krabiense]|uniref:Uncharacterized protein n=1 Tax=Sphaerisporangium krabiense TaxID=763782 RepID=A0A7W8Z269_9ACTN|nr:hypothetical protein [Sphaerisporangium krabiense]MBB5626103.1 hypothetical protein [Sphaerisporangium krabiense]GII64907.1 hypothetical protein Skr01_49920 [Sphaerisporangium krabiense]
MGERTVNQGVPVEGVSGTEPPASPGTASGARRAETGCGATPQFSDISEIDDTMREHLKELNPDDFE